MSEASGAVGNTVEASPLGSGQAGGGLLAVTIVLTAVNLRPAVASVGPVLEDIRRDLGLSGAAASILTALPILCFGAGALVTPRLVRRLGYETVLVSVLGVTTVGLVLRLGPNVVTLFAGTLVIGAAIAVALVLIPAIIKSEFMGSVGLMMGLYVTGMVVGAAVAAGATVPITESLGRSWRAGLGVWAIPAVLAFMLSLATSASRRRRSLSDNRTTEVPRSLLRDSVAWQVATFMGLQGLAFFTLLSWLPSVYRSHGVEPQVAGELLSLMIILGVPTALFLPSLLARSAQQSGWAVAAVGFSAAGLVGMVLAPVSHPYLWVTLIGVGMGASFPLALTLVVLRTRDAEGAAQLSAMSQSIGYALAGVGPFVFGVLHDFSHGWTSPLLILLVLLIFQGIAGVFAGRTVYVGESDEPTSQQMRLTNQ